MTGVQTCALPICGALLGSYLGSLVGSFSEMKEKGETEADGDRQAPIRKAGMLVAVIAADESMQALATSVLRNCHGLELELAEGEIVSGDWNDFDPRVPPKYLSER